MANKLKGMQGKKELQESWEKFTDTLNAMFKNEKKKSVDSWKTVGLHVCTVLTQLLSSD